MYHLSTYLLSTYLPKYLSNHLSIIYLIYHLSIYWASQLALVLTSLPANAGDIRDACLIPGLGRSPGGENGNTLQYCCLEDPIDRGTWKTAVPRVAKSQTRLK